MIFLFTTFVIGRSFFNSKWRRRYFPKAIPQRLSLCVTGKVLSVPLFFFPRPSLIVTQILNQCSIQETNGLDPFLKPAAYLLSTPKYHKFRAETLFPLDGTPQRQALVDKLEDNKHR